MKRLTILTLSAFLVAAAIPWGLAVGVYTLGRASGILKKKQAAPAVVSTDSGKWPPAELDGL